jgi:tetratricopeptide (TPR) repeat protein
MKQLLTIIFTLLFFNQTFACLNGESIVLKDGTLLYQDQEGMVPVGHSFNKDNFENGVKTLDSLYKATKDIDYLSDKGLLLILLERYEEAIKLYLEIEKKKPNRYSTASNIGTAYELFGQNENALKWIKKAVEIDPKSHNNSEWIHVKILEAKIKGEQFYTTSFLLNTEFGTDVTPSSQMTKQELQTLYYALYYQLNERISFVEPKEKIVAQLLFDLGNIAFLLGNYADATEDFKRAKYYGYTGQLIEQRLERTAQGEYSYLTYGLWILGCILFAILIRTIYKRRKKQIVHSLQNQNLE